MLPERTTTSGSAVADQLGDTDDRRRPWPGWSPDRARGRRCRHRATGPTYAVAGRGARTNRSGSPSPVKSPRPAIGGVLRPGPGQGDPGCEPPRAGPGEQPELAGRVAGEQVGALVAVEVADPRQQVVATQARWRGRRVANVAVAATEQDVEPPGRDDAGDEVVAAVTVQVSDRGDQVVPRQPGDRQPSRRANVPVAVPGRSRPAAAPDWVTRSGTPVAGEVGRHDGPIGGRDAVRGGDREQPARSGRPSG